MNAPQGNLSAEPQPKGNQEYSSISTVLPSIVGTTVGFGFGPSVCNAIGEATGWGTYAIATNCVAALILGVVGGLMGQVISRFVNEVPV